MVVSAIASICSFTVQYNEESFFEHIEVLFQKKNIEDNVL